MQECKTVLFHREKRKNNRKSVRKTYYWKLIFVICSYSTWTRRHVGTKKHARYVGTYARKARWHVRTQDTLARKHARHIGTWARKHTRHVSTWARKARNLADSSDWNSVFRFIWFKRWYTLVSSSVVCWVMVRGLFKTVQN